jgi:DNA phosphorothioation-associated putative methyltransferase
VLTRPSSVEQRAKSAHCPILRVYEGCGRAFLGEVEGANLIKIHRFSGKVSYLVYPDFDSDPHPALVRSVKLNMRNWQIDCQEFGQGGKANHRSCHASPRSSSQST